MEGFQQSTAKVQLPAAMVGVGGRSYDNGFIRQPVSTSYLLEYLQERTDLWVTIGGNI